ncbi:MAG: hypothetical protein A3C90_04035 [Candidatus Magasanikbacteria bacterium RIFCSPHIGHO2_02_FULL_51_14]|uniref:TrbC/VIRB2 family protein n=1 Tax=Candidatus Magasanikbacteria bacterium RIFCSPHIGHO2_02_FULL_51_14 TaxID=1798683 RepID=A0A1F6MDL8_9BACT|nr:MAG: hypothetical protein A3C90_04035 [Candidatus Magasanikbacteria bacterium RIFCSPHIGHO2_02_FULL_51_14]
MRFTARLTLLTLFTLVFLFTGKLVLAQDAGAQPEQPNVSEVVGGLRELQQFEGLPSGQELPTFIGRLIQFFTGIIGTVALGMFIWGGLLWMTSVGNAEKKKKAMLIMVWTSLGVVATLASYILVNFVFQAF